MLEINIGVSQTSCPTQRETGGKDSYEFQGVCCFAHLRAQTHFEIMLNEISMKIKFFLQIIFSVVSSLPELS